MALAEDGGLVEHDADVLVVETVRRYADQALGVARRHSDSHEDALDAYQHALLKLVLHRERLRPDTAHLWLFEVVRREALLLRKQRRRVVAVADEVLHGLMASHDASAEDRALDLDVVSRATEALGALKLDEARALTLQAAGMSYVDIGERLGWTPTKVNRALTEGRAGFRRRFADLESGKACRRWARTIARGADAPVAERARLRAHLRNCPGCRATVRELHDTSSVLAIVLPVALAGSAGTDRTGLVARAGETVGRFGDALVGGVAERAYGAAFKLQAVAEAASAAKIAAAAASAVALAGGGVAVVQQRGGDAPARVSTAGATSSPPAPAPAPVTAIPRRSAAHRASGGTGGTQTASAPVATTASGEFGSRRRAGGGSAERELANGSTASDFERPAAGAQAEAASFESSPSSSSSSSSSSGGEFAGGSSAETAGGEFGG